jgi:hypothetical protein
MYLGYTINQMRRNIYFWHKMRRDICTIKFGQLLDNSSSHTHIVFYSLTSSSLYCFYHIKRRRNKLSQSYQIIIVHIINISLLWSNT